MKKSVVIIAHNEEQHIAKCIHSILDQTVQSDEVVVIVHNSTDNTLNEVRSISDSRIIVDNYQGTTGVVAARLRGIAQATGDFILCIDGDAFAQPSWTQVMSEQLENSRVSLVGSSVVFFGTFFWLLGSPFNRILATFAHDKTGWIWGPSFAFRNEYKQNVLKFLEESVLVAKTIGLNKNPDDYWLAINMQTLGQVVYTTKTKVYAKSKQLTSRECLERNKSDVANGKKMLAYFKTQFPAFCK